MRINNQEHAWQTATFLIAGVNEDRITDINYSNKTNLKNNYGSGPRPVSRSVGKYEGEADVTLYQSAVEDLQAAAPGGDISQLPPFDIIVAFAQQLGQTPTVHKIRGVQFLDNGRKLSNGTDGGITVQLNLIIDEILWN